MKNIASRSRLSQETMTAMASLPQGPVVATVGLNVAKVEAQGLRDLHKIAEVKADAVEQNRRHDNLIDSPHVLSLGGVMGLPPSELNPKLPRVIW